MSTEKTQGQSTRAKGSRTGAKSTAAAPKRTAAPVLPEVHAEAPYSAPDMAPTKGQQLASAFSTEREQFLVQNPTDGIHHISDIDLTFGAFEVKDLMWEKAELVTQSYDLARALQKGTLVRITPEQHRRILDQQEELERVQASMAQNNNLRYTQSDRGVHAAEHINVNSETPNQGPSVSTFGSANDPQTYALAYRVYCAQCERSGILPDARSFHTQVHSSPRYLASLLEVAGYVDPSVGMASGDTRRGRATVTTAPESMSSGTGHASYGMTNFQRDNHIAGMNNAGMSSSRFDYEIPGEPSNIDLPIDAEEIDLMLD